MKNSERTLCNFTICKAFIYYFVWCVACFVAPPTLLRDRRFRSSQIIFIRRIPFPLPLNRCAWCSANGSGAFICNTARCVSFKRKKTISDGASAAPFFILFFHCDKLVYNCFFPNVANGGGWHTNYGEIIAVREKNSITHLVDSDSCAKRFFSLNPRLPFPMDIPREEIALTTRVWDAEVAESYSVCSLNKYGNRIVTKWKQISNHNHITRKKKLNVN